MPLESRTLLTGYTVDFTGGKTIYWTNDRDALPPDLREFEEVEFKDFSYVTFLVLCFQQEQKGFRYVIQIDDLYYETPDT